VVRPFQQYDGSVQQVAAVGGLQEPLDAAEFTHDGSFQADAPAGALQEPFDAV